MKKIIALPFLLLTAVTAFSALGATGTGFKSQSFIADGVSVLNVTNLLGVTNLQSISIQTNVAGTTWTNASGALVTHSTNDFTAIKNLVKDVALWDPSPIYEAVTGVNATNSNFANIYIRLVGQSGANTACTFIFVPIFDGTNESLVAADALSIAVTSSGTTVVDLATKVPAYKWIGAQGLRLKSITHPDADASSRVSVLNCSLNGFVP
jgi:hypothetical protein